MMELVLWATVFATITIASLYDIRCRYVPDYVSYSFIAIAIIERVMFFIETGDAQVIIWAAYAAIILGLMGYLMYKAGAWGGGDVKIIISTAILIACFPGEALPSSLNYFLNLLIIGAVYTIPLTIITGLKGKCKPSKKDWQLMTTGLLGGIVIFMLMPIMMGLLLGFALFIMLSMNYLKRIETNCFIKPANMKTLMDGDWLVNEVKVGRRTIKPKKEGLTKEEAEQIKEWYKNGKLKEKPLIKEGLPFLPAFLIALIPTVLGMNLLLLLVTQ